MNQNNKIVTEYNYRHNASECIQRQNQQKNFKPYKTMKFLGKFANLLSKKRNYFNSTHQKTHFNSKQLIIQKLNRNHSYFDLNQISQIFKAASQSLNNIIINKIIKSPSGTKKLYISRTIEIIRQNNAKKLTIKSSQEQLEQKHELKKRQKIQEIQRLFSSTQLLSQKRNPKSVITKNNFNSRLTHAKSQLKSRQNQIKKSLDKSLKFYNNLYPLSEEQSKLRKNILADNRWYKSLMKICKNHKLQKYEDKVIRAYFNNKPKNKIQECKSIEMYQNKQKIIRRAIYQVPVLKMKS